MYCKVVTSGALRPGIVLLRSISKCNKIQQLHIHKALQPCNGATSYVQTWPARDYRAKLKCDKVSWILSNFVAENKPENRRCRTRHFLFVLPLVESLRVYVFRISPFPALTRKHDVIHKTGSARRIATPPEDSASHGHTKHASTFGEDRTWSFGDMLADEQTSRQTHRHAIISPRYFASLPEVEQNH